MARPPVIRAAVLGAGIRGLEHAAALSGIEGVQLAGVVEPDRVARAAAARLHPTVATVGELRTAAVDYLVVATPPRTRAAVIADAVARSGARAVLAEKPLGLDVAAAREIVASCEAAGALLAVGHHWRSSAAFDRLRDVVRSGAVGLVERVHGACFGNLYDQGSHLVDAIRWVTGAEVRSVRATSEDDPVALSPLLPPDIGWYRDSNHPAPAWTTADLVLDDGVPARIEAGLLNRRVDRTVDDWRQARLVVSGTEGEVEAAASGRLRVSTPQGVEVVGSRPDAAMRSTEAMHAAVLAALRDGGPVPATGADGVASVEVVVACLQSAALGREVHLPLPATEGAAPLRVRTSAPVASVSVIINVDDDRGYAPEAITSWRHEQGYTGDVELVLASDGHQPALDERLRELLDPSDQYLVTPGATRMELWDVGARAASGEVLVITESHCAAEPDCLRALLEPLADPIVHGAAGRAVAEEPTTFSRLDAAVAEQGAATYAAPEDWRKVVPHAFAIRRDTFLEVGGFETDYDLYAEQLLGATLRRAGLPVVAVDDARVRHRFAPSPAIALRTELGLARGQAIARARRPPDELERRLYPSGGLGPVELSRRTAWAAIAGAIRSRAPLRDVLPWLVPAVTPRRVATVLAGAGVRAARARCTVWRSGPRAERAYAEMMARVTRYARRQVLAAHGPPVLVAIEDAGCWPVVDLEAGRLQGIHPPEQWDGEPFCWLEPLAVLVTQLPPGDWAITLHTGGFGRDPRRAGVTVHLDGRRLPTGAVVATERAVTVHVPTDHVRPGRAQTWSIATTPLETGTGDERRLGLPLVSVEVARA